MNWKELLFIGVLGMAIHSALFIPSLHGGAVLGVLLLVACVLLVVRNLIVRVTPSDDSSATLCDVMVHLFLFLLLANAISLICSGGTMWAATTTYSLFWPIVLSGFIGAVRKDSLVRACSVLMAVACVSWCADNGNWVGSLNLLAVISYAVCMVLPAAVLWWRSRRIAVTE